MAGCSEIATKPSLLSLVVIFLLAGCDGGSAKNPGGSDEPVFTFPDVPAATASALGEVLFNDPNLSLRRTQSCATCHDPARAFVDARQNRSGSAVSLGDDGSSLGSRNAPTLTYASLTPDFELNSDAVYEGGFFHDGRATTLQQQAGQPFLNPVEMNMPDMAAVVERLAEQAFYADSFRNVYGREDFSDIAAIFDDLTASLATYQSSSAFSTFDSRYDRWLAGEYTLTEAEERGKELFFAKGSFIRPSCVNCHRMGAQNEAPYELFTNHRYHNLGTPVNSLLRSLNGGQPDAGIGARDGLEAAAINGAFKTPTLRNVAVTGPYMHNGVLQTLDAVMEFYNFRSQPNHAYHTLNPETGKSWENADFPGQISQIELNMPTLSANNKQDLVAFLKTLTDQRYEHLLTE